MPCVITNQWILSRPETGWLCSWPFRSLFSNTRRIISTRTATANLCEDRDNRGWVVSELGIARPPTCRGRCGPSGWRCASRARGRSSTRMARTTAAMEAQRPNGRSMRRRECTAAPSWSRYVAFCAHVTTLKLNAYARALNSLRTPMIQRRRLRGSWRRGTCLVRWRRKTKKVGLAGPFCSLVLSRE
jgi:hypothetical protein